MVPDSSLHPRADERPRSAEAGDGVGEALAHGGLGFDDRVGVARGAHANELLRRMELTPEHAQHVHRRVRLALHERGDVPLIHLEAHGLVERDGVRLVRCAVEHRREPEELAG